MSIVFEYSLPPSKTLQQRPQPRPEKYRWRNRGHTTSAGGPTTSIIIPGLFKDE